jgi:hypothetical protein
MTAPEPPSSHPAPITEFQSEPMALPVSLVAHYFIAVVGAMIIGFVPEALLSPLYYNTRAARWIWVLGLLWLTFGIFDETKFWSPSWSSEKSRTGYAFAQFFGPSSKCGGSAEVKKLVTDLRSLSESVGRINGSLPNPKYSFLWGPPDYHAARLPRPEPS